MDTMFIMLNLIWLFITVNAFIIGMAASLILTALIAWRGEQWLEAFLEKHPWWMEEQDFSLSAILRRRRERKNA